jgi:DNA ligase-1
MSLLAETTLYKNHGAKTGFWTAHAIALADGGAEVRLTYAKSLDGKAVTKVDPIAGKNIGRANETTPQQQAKLELVSRVNKQLDKGYVRTIEEAAAPATNTLGKKKPMLATDVDKVKEESIDWDNAFVQRKLDGHRCLSDEFIYSRGGKQHDVAHVQAAVDNHPGLQALHLDGELYVHGLTLQAIGSLITRPREESLQLAYYVYDTVGNEPFEERFKKLETATCGVVWGTEQHLVLVETHKVRNMAEAMLWHRKWVKEGYEGTILRHGLGGYEDDKRSKRLIKLKDFTDLEVAITGWELGTPIVVKGVTYQVPVLSYEHKAEDGTKVGKVTAMGDAAEKHAEYLALLAGENIGRLMTIEHFKFTPAGVPNIATAKCWYAPL